MQWSSCHHSDSNMSITQTPPEHSDDSWSQCSSGCQSLPVASVCGTLGKRCWGGQRGRWAGHRCWCGPSRRLLQSSNVSIEQDEVVAGLQNDSRHLQFLDNFFILVVILVIFSQRTLRTAVLITVTFPRWISTGQSVLWFTGVHCRLQPSILVQAATMYSSGPPVGGHLQQPAHSMGLGNYCLHFPRIWRKPQLSKDKLRSPLPKGNGSIPQPEKYKPGKVVPMTVMTAKPPGLFFFLL